MPETVKNLQQSTAVQEEKARNEAAVAELQEALDEETKKSINTVEFQYNFNVKEYKNKLYRPDETYGQSLTTTHLLDFENRVDSSSSKFHIFSRNSASSE